MHRISRVNIDGGQDFESKHAKLLVLVHTPHEVGSECAVALSSTKRLGRCPRKTSGVHSSPYAALLNANTVVLLEVTLNFLITDLGNASLV